MKAVVLAAGEGSRLRPYTENKPKVMLPVLNRPILDYVLEALVECKVKQATLVVGYRQQRVRDMFADGEDRGISLSYTEQRQQLGTAHALRQVAGQIEDEDVLVVNGDNLLDAKALQALLDAPPLPARLLATPLADVRGYGVVSLSGDRLTDITEKPRVTESHLVNTGTYVLTPRAMEYVKYVPLSSRGEYELTAALSAMLKDGLDVAAIQVPSGWMDVVYPWDLLSVNARLLERRSPVKSKAPAGVTLVGDVSIGSGSRLEPGTYVVGPALIGSGCEIGPGAVVLPSTTVGDNVTIGPHTEVRNSVLMNGCRIDTGAVVRDSVIGEHSVIGAHTCTTAGRATVVFEEEVHRPTIGAMVGDNVTIGERVVLRHGVRVGGSCVVGPNVDLRDDLPAGALLL